MEPSSHFDLMPHLKEHEPLRKVLTKETDLKLLKYSYGVEK
jgi:hypothetical protein